MAGFGKGMEGKEESGLFGFEWDWKLVEVNGRSRERECRQGLRCREEEDLGKKRIWERRGRRRMGGKKR